MWIRPHKLKLLEPGKQNPVQGDVVPGENPGEVNVQFDMNNNAILSLCMTEIEVIGFMSLVSDRLVQSKTHKG